MTQTQSNATTHAKPVILEEARVGFGLVQIICVYTIPWTTCHVLERSAKSCRAALFRRHTDQSCDARLNTAGEILNVHRFSFARELIVASFKYCSQSSPKLYGTMLTTQCSGQANGGFKQHVLKTMTLGHQEEDG